jgi:Tol biopolymer transport system component
MDSNGVVTQFLPIKGEFKSLLWRPHTMAISYILGSSIVLSSTIWSNGQLELGEPKVIVEDDFTTDRYSWSPSGRWIATRSGVLGKDKIYLINADHPEQTVDVALAANIPQIIGSPAWSPDGKTLLVMDESNDQPYAINIADYLHSKGLEV